MRKMIELQWSDAFASGGKRYCFVHPDDADKCIKVVFKLSNNDTTAKEAKFWERPIIIYRLRGGGPFSEFFGQVETSLGVGTVFSLIRDGDGSISRTLLDVLNRNLGPENLGRYAAALEKFKKDYLRSAITCRDIGARNICVREVDDDHAEMLLVDGFGHRYWFPVVDYIPFLARKKMKARLEMYGYDDLANVRARYVDPDRKQRETDRE